MHTSKNHAYTNLLTHARTHMHIAPAVERHTQKFTNVCVSMQYPEKPTRTYFTHGWAGKSLTHTHKYFKYRCGPTVRIYRLIHIHKHTHTYTRRHTQCTNQLLCNCYFSASEVGFQALAGWNSAVEVVMIWVHVHLMDAASPTLI